MSRKLSAKRFAAAVRGHCSIETSLHWQLDVTFQEDQSRLRRGHADANFSILRGTPLQLAEEQHNAQNRRQEQTSQRRLG
jgi:predicted transposase YbfD/YdcC